MPRRHDDLSRRKVSTMIFPVKTTVSIGDHRLRNARWVYMMYRVFCYQWDLRELPALPTFSIISFLIVSYAHQAQCLEETTTVCTLTGLWSSYSTVTCDFLHQDVNIFNVPFSLNSACFIIIG